MLPHGFAVRIEMNFDRLPHVEPTALIAHEFSQSRYLLFTTALSFNHSGTTAIKRRDLTHAT
jgi:hypothetical protein